MKATTKPVTVEAVQWRGDNIGEIKTFFPNSTSMVDGTDGLFVHDFDAGYVPLKLGHWAVRSEHLGVSTMSDDAFHASYDLTEG